MTFLVERVAELRQHLEHLRQLRPRVSSSDTLETDRSLRNDVLFTLLMICQIVIDIAARMSAERAERFETYREAIRNLIHDPRFPAEVVHALEPLSGFRNVVVHEYLAVDLNLVFEALNNIDAIERFVQILASIESAS